jgi:predicted secreted protein
MGTFAFRRHYLPILVAIAGPTLALFSIACSGPTSPDRDITVTLGYDDFSQNHNYSGTVRLLAGGTLTVKLFSNTASTGASWSNPAQISDPAVLEQTDHVYVPPSSPNPGAGGQDVWTLRAIGKGDGVVYMEYKRPFDTLPAWTFSLAVNVL